MNTEPKNLNDDKEPKTIEEFKAAYDKIKAEKIALEIEKSKIDGERQKAVSSVSDLEEENETAKRIIAKYKRKYGSLDAEDRPPITPVRFS